MPGRNFTLGLWLALLAAAALVIVHTQFRTDMADFLPRSAPMAQSVLTEQATSGAASHLVLVAITGAPQPALAALSEALATRLRQQQEFTNVMNGDAQSFADTQNFIFRNRYLLSPGATAANFTAAGLHTALTNDLALLGSDMAPMLQQTLPADPTGALLTLLPQLENGPAPPSTDGVWFSPNGASAILLVHTAAAGFDLDTQQQDIARLNADFAQIRAAIPGAGTARVNMTGPGIFGVHTRDLTKRDVMRLSVLATIGAISLLIFAYRSPLVLVLGLLPVASGALAAIATVSLAFGFVHGVTLGFGVTLIGESLDYAVYLFTQTKRGDSARDTLARIWPVLRLGMLTSVAGFAAMLWSSFTGFAQLGLFSIAGLIVAAATTRFVLPHLVPQNFYAPGAAFFSKPIGAVITYRRRLRWLLATLAALSGILLLTHRGGFWNPNLSDLSPIPASDMQLDQTLRADLGVPDIRYFAVLQASTEQQALQQSEALALALSGAQAQGKLTGFDVPSSLLPSAATQAARQTGLPNATALHANFTRASAGLPFRPGIFAPFFQDVAATKTAPLLTPENLPPALALQFNSMLIHNPTGWIVMAPLRGVTNPQAVAGAIAGTAVFVDLNRESAQLLHRFEVEASALAITGSIAILILLLLGLRSLRRVIAIAAPLATAVLITAALLTAGNQKLSIFMVVGFLLIIAVGSNYCLFFERSEPDVESWRRSIASILLANLCTVCAYGLMAFSSIPVLHDIGKTVAVGTFLTLLCAAVLSRPGHQSPTPYVNNG